MLAVEKFIRENKNWKDLIQESPYYISIVDDEKYFLLKYQQIKSDFNNDIVKECRGIIFNRYTLKPVCVPFFKFGNYGESYADEIDWSTAKVQEKIDGSLIKLWYDNEWHISTNGTIDASKADIQNCILYKNFKELFLSCADIDINSLNKNYTYMFELVSPYNQVVIKYPETKIYHIGTRDNITLQELNIDIGIEKPKLYNISTIEDCIKSASILDSSHEGFVVVDDKYHRVKVKNPIYVSMHHAVNNHMMTLKRVINIVDMNEVEEFLNYFPEYIDIFTKVCYNIGIIKKELSEIIETLHNHKFKTRKDLALYAKAHKYTEFYFKIYDYGYVDANTIWNDLNISQKERLLQNVDTS